MPGTRFENWDTDEPSERGIGGIEPMRLVRDDIADRVADLLTRMVVDQRGCGPIIPPGLIIGPIIAGMPSLTKPVTSTACARMTWVRSGSPEVSTATRPLGVNVSWR
jgi:hypothetical protein